jgi:hypothetical protein
VILRQRDQLYDACSRAFQLIPCDLNLAQLSQEQLASQLQRASDILGEALDYVNHDG